MTNVFLKSFCQKVYFLLERWIKKVRDKLKTVGTWFLFSRNITYYHKEKQYDLYKCCV